MLTMRRKSELEDSFYALRLDYDELSLEERDYVDALTLNYNNATEKILGKIVDADQKGK